jgi:hypothetical protein
MAFYSVPQDWIGVGKALVQSLFQRMKDDLDWLYAVVGSASAGDIPNGSFEIDSDNDGVPDNVTVELYPGGSSGLSDTDSVHGEKVLYFTHPGGEGNGGGKATLDYAPCSPNKLVVIAFELWATAAGMRNLVQVAWYDKDRVALEGGDASTDIYDSVDNPTEPARFIRSASPPAAARFFRPVLHGGVDDTDVAGTAYFDNVELLQTGAEAVIGWASGYDPGTSIVIDGVTSSPVSGADVLGARKNVLGGRNVTTTCGSLSVILTLPDGPWTIVAHNGYWTQPSEPWPDPYGALTVVAFRNV